MATGLHVHNLDHPGLVLVMVSVIGVGITTFVRQTRAEARAAADRLSLRGVAG